MKTLVKNVILLSFIGLAVSCQVEETEKYSENVRIIVTVSDDEETRVSEDGSRFVSGDQIKVWNTSRATDNSATFVYSEDSDEWSTDGTILWEGTGTNVFYAWHPASSDYHAFTIPEDQSSGISVSDWMTAYSEADPSDGGVELSFRRHLSKFSVQIVGWGTEYPESARNVNKVQFRSLSSVMTNDGDYIYGNGTSVMVTSYVQTQNEKMTAIIAPGQYPAGSEIMHVYVNGAMSPLVVKTSAALTVKPGKAYDLKLTVGRDNIEISPEGVTVSGWDDEVLDDCVVDVVARNLEFLDTDVDVSFEYEYIHVPHKSNVDFEVIIPQDVSWISYDTAKLKENLVYLSIDANKYNNARSAVVTLKQIGGDLSTSVTISQDYFKGFDDSIGKSSKYLTYVSNTTSSGNGDAFDYNLYIKNTYFETNTSNVVRAEYKFKMPSSSTDIWPLSGDIVKLSGTSIRVYAGREDGDRYYSYFDMSSVNVNYTDEITLVIDGQNGYVTINGKMLKGEIAAVMDSYVYSGYYHDRDDGEYEEYKKFMDGARLYYAKGWDSYGRLVYLGYASKSTNSTTGSVEACWKSSGYNGYSVYGKTTFANYKSENYQPLGMGNL